MSYYVTINYDGQFNPYSKYSSRSISKYIAIKYTTNNILNLKRLEDSRILHYYYSLSGYESDSEEHNISINYKPLEKQELDRNITITDFDIDRQDVDILIQKKKENEFNYIHITYDVKKYNSLLDVFAISNDH